MIPFEQAFDLVLSSAPKPVPESVRLGDSLNRVTAAETVSDADIPASDRAAVDGYACRAGDRASWMRLVETIPAGRTPFKTISFGECSKVMAGAMIPEGTECVAAKEDAEEKDGFVRVVSPSDEVNIRRTGADIHGNQAAVPAGARITPVVAAILAAAGADPVSVARRPKVSVISTGDELVEPGHIPGKKQMRNSNGLQLCAQSVQAGCTVAYRGIARDTHESIHRFLSQSLGESDIVIFSGGSSHGDFDLVPAVLRTAGATVKFERVAVHPGSSIMFATHQGTCIFGLPGDPFSSYVMFEILVRPLMMKMTGCTRSPGTVWAHPAQPVRRQAVDVLEFVPVKLNGDGTCSVLSGSGPAHIHAMARADGLMALLPYAESSVNDDAEIMLLDK